MYLTPLPQNEKCYFIIATSVNNMEKYTLSAFSFLSIFMYKTQLLYSVHVYKCMYAQYVAVRIRKDILQTGFTIFFVRKE